MSIKKLLLEKFSPNIVNIVFYYQYYDYDKLIKLYNKRCNNPIFNGNKTDIFETISKCCLLGYCGFIINGLNPDIINLLKKDIKKFNNIFEFIICDDMEIIKLKNISGQVIHYHAIHSIYYKYLLNV